mmetsp:Transcript_31491/g.50843  ORF Transcript_31491/g.50843 Transcript_31491/m.50843 type:complete len:139 (-) Transcript_31491:186-602(-)|eukprot:CAMPEP_0184648644 /NCGR_PEP_ID=MMETSP0308-20130426/5807_1 /TAXON_ID=38269 /ORGANISM="Gloeochaete witrockiana, Strain SAG 46.84" /LENGTH=138 /DNA_ID=CAMNT_0027080649 /DNA_START=103 /DNA_END=519 /DNA_ORIENTATION=+
MEQDWEQVVFRKKTPGAGTSGSKAVAQARQTGAEVETLKKFNAGANRKVPTSNTAKLDAETEELHHERVSLTTAQSIQQGRQGKKWTQKQLAQAINEQANLIAEYENGKAIPNPQILVKIERALGVKIPRAPAPAKKA